MAITRELGLDRPPRDAGVNTISEFPIAEALPHLPLPASSARTMNERRSVISCYILSSVYATLPLFRGLEMYLLNMQLETLNSSGSWSLCDGTNI